MEKGGADPRRRGERADPPEGRADTQRLLSQGRHDQSHRQVGRNEQQPAAHHPLAYGQPVPGAPVRAGGSRDFRRSDHHQEDRPHPRRARQGRRGVLRRAHRPGGCLRRHEGFAHLLDRQGAAQREYRRGELHGKPDADDPAFAQPRKGVVHHHRRGEDDRFGLPQARPGFAGHRQGRSQHPSLEDAHRL